MEHFSEFHALKIGNQDQRVLKKAEGVICKSSLVILEGTLSLTDNRLIFDLGDEPIDSKMDDAEEINESKNEENKGDDYRLSIPLESIISVRGKKGIVRPSLFVVWRKSPTDQKFFTEFIQKSKADRKEDNINEWQFAIEEASESKNSTLQQRNLSQYNFYNSSLEAKILAILDDSEWTGTFQIKSELEKRYDEDWGIEEIDSSCKKLIVQRLIEQEENGDFFRKSTVQRDAREK